MSVFSVNSGRGEGKAGKATASPVWHARAVLNAWKRRDAYCRSVLACSARIGFEGSETGETVDDVARAKAREMIAQREASRQREVRKAALRQAALAAMDQPAIAARSD